MLRRLVLASTLMLFATARRTSCPSGTFLQHTQRRRRLSHCARCEAGTFLQEAPALGGDAVSRRCLDCPAGKFTDRAGQVTCVGGPVCAPGTYGVARATSAAAASTCAPCVPGSFQPVSGQSECLPCQGGTYSAEAGSTQCVGTPCVAGRYGVRSRATREEDATCAACAVGHFAAHDGVHACVPCPRRYHQYATGATHCEPDPRCPIFTYYSHPTRRCEALHAHVRLLAVATWTLFGLSILCAFLGCRRRLRLPACAETVREYGPCAPCVIALTAGGVGIHISRRHVQHAIEDAPFYIMVGFLATPLTFLLSAAVYDAILYARTLATPPPTQRSPMGRRGHRQRDVTSVAQSTVM